MSDSKRNPVEKTLDQMTPEESERWMKMMDRQWAVIENEINRRQQERKAKRGWPHFLEQDDDDEEMEELDLMLSKIKEARELLVAKEKPKMAQKIHETMENAPTDHPILMKMKHGWIEGFWDAEEREGSGYYYQTLTWFPTAWCYLPDWDIPQDSEE